jgi:hypothetical protein
VEAPSTDGVHRNRSGLPLYTAHQGRRPAAPHREGMAHCTLHCPLSTTLHIPLHCTLHTAHCTLHTALHCAPPSCTIGCYVICALSGTALHCTALHCTAHQGCLFFPQAKNKHPCCTLHTAHCTDTVCHSCT